MLATELQCSDHEKGGTLDTLFLAVDSSHPFLENRKDPTWHPMLDLYCKPHGQALCT